MKFCKNLQKVVGMADPAWAPFWLNYKQLKKSLKNLRSFETSNHSPATSAIDSDASSSDEVDKTTNSSSMKQNVGDITEERANGKRKRESFQTEGKPPSRNQNPNPPAPPIGQNPDEIKFFKLLHAELKKCQFFYAQTTKEFSIREERMRKGIEVIKGQDRCMVEKWRTTSKAIYLLYRDLLLLETFAIMTYVGFSKILKKHDKVTGYRTCNAYMERIVNGANFTHYPEVMAMVSRCEKLQEEISLALEQEGINALSRDEQLFISVIQQIGVEVRGNDEMDGGELRPSSVSEESKAVDDLRELLGAESNVAEPDSGHSEKLERPPTMKLA